MSLVGKALQRALAKIEARSKPEEKPKMDPLEIATMEYQKSKDSPQKQLRAVQAFLELQRHQPKPSSEG